MELQLAPFELAKKLKEVGFKAKISRIFGGSGVSAYYNYEGIKNGDCTRYLQYRNLHGKDSPNKYDNIPAPTLELAKMWIRDRYGFYIDPICVGFHEFGFRIWDFPTECSISITHEDIESKGSYDEALEAGLLKICELIKEQNGRNSESHN